MSLQVWLPLRNGLAQQGASVATVSDNKVSYFDGYGALFYTEGSYLLSDTGPLTNDTEDWTYTCWFSPDSAHNGCLLSSRTAVNTTGIAIFYYTNSFLFDDGVRWTFTPSTMPTVNLWNHLAFVRRKGVGKFFYLNGELLAQTGTTGTPTAVGPRFSIGASQQNQSTPSGNQLDGELNDVRIYTHALTATEIKRLAECKVVHLLMNGNGTGSTTDTVENDISGFMYDGTKRNAMSYSSGSPRYNAATVFNGSSDNISGVFPGRLLTTFMLWVKFNSTPTGTHVLDCRDSNGVGCQPMYITSSYIQIGNSWSAFPNVSYSFGAGVWYHIAVVYNVSWADVYVNGVRISRQVSVNQSASEEGALQPYYIGSRYSNTNWLNGSVSDFRIYKTALSADAIADIYKGNV